MNYKDEQRDNAIYDNEMVYFLFLDGITKTKPYFDIYMLVTYFLFNEIENKVFHLTAMLNYLPLMRRDAIW